MFLFVNFSLQNISISIVVSVSGILVLLSKETFVNVFAGIYILNPFEIPPSEGEK